MNKKDFQQFMRHCQVIQKLSEDRNLLRVQETQQLIVVRYLKNASSDLIPILSQQKDLTHEHLESIIDYCQVSPDCIAVFTEYSTHTLEDELQARRKANSPFSLEQVENILVSVIKALCYLQSKSVGHGCISARDIVVSQNGTVKLIDPSLATSSPLHLIAGYYYSPELLMLNRKKISINSTACSISQLDSENIDFFKNDVFVVGMLAIQFGLLYPGLQQCVNYEQGCIDYLVVERFLNQFSNTFNHQPFINLLCGMLQEDPISRFNAQETLNFIEQQFEQSQQDEYEIQQNMEGSYQSSELYSSKNKTVKSFLLSQGPISQIEHSLRSSQGSVLFENPSRINRFSMNRNQKSGRTPLIKC